MNRDALTQSRSCYGNVPGGRSVATIQLIGQWRSQAFMRHYYIRIQVQQMTKGVADVLTANPDFFTIEGKDAESQLQKSP
jgi:hypothetical protein